MDEFITMITNQLGITEQQGRSATGGVLKLLKDKLDEGTFSDLLNQLPGAEGLVSQSESAPQGLSSGGGGLMGSLTSMAGSLLGGKGSIVAQVGKTLSESGIGIDKAGGFLSTLVSFLKDKLGEDAFRALAEKLPELFRR